MIAPAPSTNSPILSETRLTMAQFARWQNVSHNTALGWFARGRKGLRLARLRIGGRWFTSREAFYRWVEAINESKADNVATTQLAIREKVLALRGNRSPAQVAQAARAAVAEL